MITDVVILAGGFGERLWPASSPENPKQFMTLSGGLSFMQSSIFRALSLEVSGKIIIVTRADLVASCVKQGKEMAEKLKSEKLEKDLYVLSEPSPRHTAAAIMSASLFLEKIEPEKKHTVLVLTSDHVIEPVSAFVSDAKKAATCAEDGNLVCFAIPPTEAATGYGYIKEGESLTADTFRIDSFKEKPDAETAKEYLASGKYFWNSGMFAFTTDFLLDELAKCTPEVTQAFEVVKNGSTPEVKRVDSIGVIEGWKELEAAYSTTPKVAIDTSLAEKTSHASCVRTTFTWTDVGSWDVFSELSDSVCPRVAEVEAKDNFVYSDIPVALCGVEDLIVVIKNGSALVMKKGSSEYSRKVVEAMKE